MAAVAEAMAANQRERKEHYEAVAAEAAVERAAQAARVEQLLSVLESHALERHALERSDLASDEAALRAALDTQKREMEQRHSWELQQQQHLKEIADAAKSIATIQEDVHGYRGMQQLRVKLGRIIFVMTILGGWIAFWNPTGLERAMILGACASTPGKAAIAGTLLVYTALHAA